MRLTERFRQLYDENKDLSQILNASAIETTQEDKIRYILGTENPTARLTENNVFAGLTIGDFLYDALRIDPNVIESADFARAADLGDIFRFSVFADKLSGYSESALDGSITNLKGYLAERVVAQHLQSAGMEVEFPEASNQEGYDLLVNGVKSQVKCLADKAGVLEHLEKYPDIPVFVNWELAESLQGVPNVYPVPVLSNEMVEETTRNSIECGDEMLDFEIPAIAIAVALGKNAYKFYRGSTDLKSGAINTLYDVTGGVIGGKIGAAGLTLMGGLLGPYGVVVGGMVGAITGSIYGRRWTTTMKRWIHTSDEEKQLNNALIQFLTISHYKSQKSREVFNKKASELVRSIESKGAEFEQLLIYVKKRLNEEKIYLDNRINELIQGKNNPYALDRQYGNILVAASNGIELSLRAKVHPATIQPEMENLTQKIQSMISKQKKLS